MHVASLILPIFAIILTGWLAGTTGYLARSVAGPLMQFAYYVAMPALVFLTVAKEPLDSLLEWRFLAAFGGGSILCFVAVLLAARLGLQASLGKSAMLGAVLMQSLQSGMVLLGVDTPVQNIVVGAVLVLAVGLDTLYRRRAGKA